MSQKLKTNFIVIEGIDGCGGSTQAALLHDHLVSRGQRAIVTSEPSSGPIGSLIRLGFSRRVELVKNSHLFDQQMAYLFAADRHDHLYNERDGVFKFLETGTHVVSTRYFFSSMAYHCDTDKELQFVKGLNAAFPDPDHVIYLDNPVEVSIERIKHRKVKDAYETSEKLKRVSVNYKKIFSEYNGSLLRIDATLSPQIIHDKIVQFISGSTNG